MNQEIAALIEKTGIPVFGACRFHPEDLKIPCRAVSRVPACARTVFVFGFPYLLAEYSTGRNLSRYACAPDYHNVAGQVLEQLVLDLSEKFPEEEFAAFADISPFDEVLIAARAGLGVIGRNTLLIHPEYGSWMFLGEIVTTLELPVEDAPVKECIGCGNCERLCPGGALNGGQLREEYCLSFLTQKKRELSDTEQDLIKKGGLVWGCDICQTVCPMNRNVKIAPFKPLAQDLVERVTEENAAELCKVRAFGFRGAKVIWRNLSILGQKGGNTTGESNR